MIIKIITKEDGTGDVVNAETGEHVEGITDINIMIIPNTLPIAYITLRRFESYIIAEVKDEPKPIPTE